MHAPHLITALPGPKAAAWIARDERVVSPSYTRDYPLVAARGWGSTIEDVDGNLFLDFTAGIAVTATGHAHPEVVAAIADQASKLIHMSGTDFYYAPEIELAERLAQLAPGDRPKRVFFTNSGAETVEAALKLARFHTRRQRVISFFGAFHGRTYGALSLGGSKALHQRGFGPTLAGVNRAHFDCSRAELDELFATVAPPEEVAAIFVEPIQGEGGYRVPSPGFLPMLRSVCDQYGITLVVDEIQSGIGRTGRMFAVEHWNVVPDMICLAKGIASGLPLGALVTRADLMDWPPGAHASTFGGNPVSCRAALATLELVEREYLANAAVRGEQLHAGLVQLAERFPILANPRGRGLMRAIDCTAPNDGSADDLDRRRCRNIVHAAFAKGLLLLSCGRAALRFCPPLCVTADEVDTALRILGAVLAEIAMQPAG
ncbi:MAG TPA: aminotransferase class III-fold pyridoxal phosphate-dependent enzyme [Pirellulales bacterium]|jgi:4-aminobutyrate aminotransferase|nr:aminotransferase class III-fold pyridoxal phosphate-dependent enzyme [Pirellulales bacterium]